MGALRRPQDNLEQRDAPSSPPIADTGRQRGFPRWIVVSGLIFYCSAFWLLIWAVGSLGVDLVRTATAGAP